MPGNNGRWHPTEAAIERRRDTYVTTVWNLLGEPALTREALQVSIRRVQSNLKMLENAMTALYLTCEVCGERICTHLTCDSCGILIGPDHLEPLPVSLQGVTICRNCQALYQEAIVNKWPVAERIVSLTRSYEGRRGGGRAAEPEAARRAGADRGEE